MIILEKFHKNNIFMLSLINYLERYSCKMLRNENEAKNYKRNRVKQSISRNILFYTDVTILCNDKLRLDLVRDNLGLENSAQLPMWK